MSRLPAVLISWTVVTLGCPLASQAQVKDAFVERLADFVNAAAGDDAAAVASAIDAMAAALAQWDAAVAKVEAGLAANIGGVPAPVAARMRAALGTVYLERGRMEAAAGQFEAALALDPELDEVHLLRGILLQHLQRAGGAASAFRSAWQRDRQNAAAAYYVLRSGSNDSAAAEAKDALEALAAGVEVATGGGPLFPVVALFDESAVAAPIFAPAVYGPGIALVLDAKYEEAIAVLRQTVVLHSTARDERSLLDTADRLVASGDHAGARAALEEAIGRLPRSGLAHWRLGTLHRAMGDEQAALRSFETAAALPAVGGAGHLYAAIGRLHHNRLDLEAAAAAFAGRVRISPNDSAAHMDLGEIFLAQEKLEGALGEYLIAARLDPSSADAFAMIGQVQAAAGRDDQAVPMLRKAVTLDAGHLQARYALSRALLRQGRGDEARQELAAFQQLQAKAMEEERRRFRENQVKIDATLGAGATSGAAR